MRFFFTITISIILNTIITIIILIVVDELVNSQWMEKEIASLSNSSLRLALLSIIRRYQQIGGIYGYKISEKLLESTDGELDASNATFYAILRRLEKDGLINSQVQPSDQGPPRKHYYLTELGDRVLDELYLHWQRHFYFLSQLKEDSLRGEQ